MAGLEREWKLSAWSYELADGWQVVAGKTDVDNDILSLHLAGPQDWWFHLHGQPGSHVILKARAGLEPSKEVLLAAAAVAAWHSKARNAGVVPVVCTRAANVSKPRGAKPGTVAIRHEKILKVRPALPQT